jgi:hypothetical protein
MISHSITAPSLISQDHTPGLPPPAGEGLRGLPATPDTTLCPALCQRPMDRTSAADQSPQIMADRGRAFGGRTAAGALAPEREHRTGIAASSLKMTPTPPDRSRIDRAGARSGVCAAAWPVSPLPFRPVRGIEYSAPIARTTASIQRTEPSLWILVWHDHCCLTPLARKLSPIDGEQCRGRAT